MKYREIPLKSSEIMFHHVDLYWLYRQNHHSCLSVSCTFIFAGKTFIPSSKKMMVRCWNANPLLVRSYLLLVKPNISDREVTIVGWWSPYGSVVLIVWPLFFKHIDRQTIILSKPAFIYMADKISGHMNLSLLYPCYVALLLLVTAQFAQSFLAGWNHVSDSKNIHCLTWFDSGLNSHVSH